MQIEHSVMEMKVKYLVARRGTLLMELVLLRHYFGNFSTRGQKYYFCLEWSMQGEMFAAMVGCIRDDLCGSGGGEHMRYVFEMR